MRAELPSVGVLCLTRNRRQWLPQAIRCFQAQDYPAKEMLILADGEDVKDLVPQDDRRIHLHTIPNDSRPRTVGEKRNLGCCLLAAELIAVQDDDDYYAPGRLSDQVSRLIASGRAVAGYHSANFTDGTRWWRYSGTANLALGASLCFRRDWWLSHPFPHEQVGQDETFGYEAAAANQLISVDAGNFLVATVHPRNTSRRDTDKDPWVEHRSFSGVPGFVWPGGVSMETAA